MKDKTGYMKGTEDCGMDTWKGFITGWGSGIEQTGRI